MRKIIFGAAALGFLMPFAPSALAADVEGFCLEQMEKEDVPPEVTQEQINYFCSCLDTGVNDDADLLSEFEIKSASEAEEEMGDNFKTLQKSCQEEALAQ